MSPRLRKGDTADAYLIARGPNPFASICGRVCAAPCEAACRRGTVDAPIAIRALKRFVSEQFGVESFAASSVWHAAHGPVPAPTEPSVGVVGGGPAGLAAACDLRLAGHPVTVYEAEDRLGGMMVLGIPEYRLARGLITREIDAILELGIEVRTGFRVGQQQGLDGAVRAARGPVPRDWYGPRRAISSSPAMTSMASCGPSSTSSTSTRDFTWTWGSVLLSSEAATSPSMRLAPRCEPRLAVARRLNRSRSVLPQRRVRGAR